MAYFSNGTEGADYQAQYCDRCIHDANQDCPIWLAHLLHNGTDGDAAEVLDLLIPRSGDGLGNERCRLFVGREAQDATR
jgi:hypothetical protein